MSVNKLCVAIFWGLGRYVGEFYKLIDMAKTLGCVGYIEKIGCFTKQIFPIVSSNEDGWCLLHGVVGNCWINHTCVVWGLYYSRSSHNRPPWA